MSETRHEQALAHAQAGRLQEAFQLYGELLNENRNDTDALHFFAVLDIHQKNFQQAYVKTLKIRELRPDWVKSCNTHGSACFGLGKVDEARVAYETGLALEPDNLELQKNLASMIYQGGEIKKAHDLFMRIAVHQPDDLQAQLDVIECERQLGQLDEAFEKAKNLLGRAPQMASVQNAIANIYKQLGRANEALSHYQKAIELESTNGILYGNAGATLIDLGRPVEAAPHLKKSMELTPAHSEPFYLVSRNLQSNEEALSLIASVEKALEIDRLDDQSKSDFEFALYGAYHYLKEDDKAFAHLIVANRLRYQNRPFDLQGLQQYFSEIKETGFVRDVSLELEGPETPIFILGMPRSGTTLVEQIIASHSNVAAGGELSDLGRIAYGVGYPTRLQEIQLKQARADYLGATGMKGQAFFTDKMPGNFQYIGLIKALWPQARIIHCVRHPMDTCLSNFQMRFSRGHAYIYDQQALGGYYRAYHDLMDHWLNLFRDDIYTVVYEKMVADQEGESRKLLAYCGLKWEEGCLEFYKSEKSVRTASATQVRREIYRSALDRWKRYEKQLSPLRAVLGELVAD